LSSRSATGLPVGIYFGRGGNAVRREMTYDTCQITSR